MVQVTSQFPPKAQYLPFAKTFGCSLRSLKVYITTIVTVLNSDTFNESHKRYSCTVSMRIPVVTLRKIISLSFANTTSCWLVSLITCKVMTALFKLAGWQL